MSRGRYALVLAFTLACLGPTRLAADAVCSSIYATPIPDFPLIWPTPPAPISQPFARWGDGSAERYHTGIDIAVPVGTKVRAVAEGWIVLLCRSMSDPCQDTDEVCKKQTPSNCHGAGHTVILRHNNGVFSQYQHLSRFEYDTGKHVDAGAIIALSGNTGTTQGVHLHFELKSAPVLHNPKFRGSPNPSQCSDKSRCFWGYVPTSPLEDGYFDPMLNFLVDGSNSGGVISKYLHRARALDDGVTIRTGPGTSFTAIDSTSVGDQFLASAKAPATNGCSLGWLRVIKDTAVDSCFGPGFSSGWACRGNEVAYFEEGPAQCQQTIWASKGSGEAADCLGRPQNDDFADATLLEGNSGSVYATTDGATSEAGEPAHAGNPPAASVWWTWVAPEDGSLILSTAGSEIDTVLAFYTGPAVSNLQALASNDDAPGATHASLVTASVQASRTYRIAIDGFGGGQGNVALLWLLTPASVKLPARPSGLKASDGVFTDRVHVEWKPVAAAESYRVERTLSLNNQFELLEVVSSSATDDYDLGSEEVGYYRVAACVAGGCGDFSDVDAGYRTAPAAADFDFRIDAFASIPTRLDPGEYTSMSARIENLGSGASPVGVVRYLRSADNRIEPTDEEFARDDFGPIDAGSATATIESLHPPNQPAEFYVGACVEPVPGETRVDNQCSSAVQISVLGTCYSDFAEPNDSCETASPFIPTLAWDYTLCDDDWYYVPALAGATYEVQTFDLSVAADTFLDVYEDDCSTLLASDDDGGGGLSSRVEVAPEGNALRIRVSAFGGSYSGSRFAYRMSVRCISGCSSSSAEARQLLAADIDVPLELDSCGSLYVGDTTVAPNGVLTLRSSKGVVFSDGFRVEEDGVLEVGGEATTCGQPPNQ